jgi:LysR family nitrogen assimilation transcriptional regulator
MDLRRVRTFVAIAEQGTVSKAALKLHISQPGLSRQIHELEQELGLRLFDRVGRGLVLTPEGAQLLGSCRQLLGQASAVGEHAELLKRGDRGALKVAASPIQIETALASFLPGFSKRYPYVQVTVIESVGTNTLALLERGEIHLGIGLVEAVAAQDQQFGCYPVPALHEVAACHPSFPLERGRTIDIGSIAPHPLLLLDTAFSGRKNLDAVCRLAGIKPNILIESRSPHTLLALAEAGLGVAIVGTAVQTSRYKLRTALITYKGRPIQNPLAVVWNKRRPLPQYAQDFCRLLADHIRKLFPIRPVSKVRNRRGRSRDMNRDV